MSTTTTPVTNILQVPMPSARSTTAPRFDGTEVTSFLESIVQHGANAGIVDLDNLVPYILEYSVPDVKQLIRFMPEFDPEATGKTWAKAKAHLLILYGASERVPDYTVEMLKSFVEKSYVSSHFSNMTDVASYYRSFCQVAVPLVKKAKITGKERDFYFIAGLPKEVKDWFLTQVPDANRKRSDPPDVPASIAILKTRFDEDSLAFRPWTELTQVSTTLPLNPLANTSIPTTTNAPANAQSVPTTVDELTRQLERLSLALAAAQTGNANANVLTNAPPLAIPMPPEDRRCFMCGKTPPSHRIGVRNCESTHELLRANIIRYDLNQSRYVMADTGADLPRTPPGFPGGVADYLLALRASADGGQAARTHSMGLIYGESPVLIGNNFAVSSLEQGFHDAYPVTRGGKDSAKNVRFDPIARPDVKSRPRDAPPHLSSKPPITEPKLPPSSSSVPPSATNPPPQQPTNPINRADGWKGSQPSSSRAKDGQDVVMRDAKKPANDKYHITSEFQERTDAKAVFEGLIKTQVNLPLLDLIGLSPALQKLFTDSTRSRREYGVKSAEYSASALEEHRNSDLNQGFGYSESRHAYSDASVDDIQEFLVNYGSAVAKVPEGRYFAMSTGSIIISIGQIELSAMIDTGSELNLAGRSVPERCNLPVDFEGMKWALKGIHGGPEQLRGCATDVSMRIGGHNFPHHLFISHQEIGHHDIILGQPFLQWFAARIDYERHGAVSMYLWKNGSRKVNPTIVITITDPNDSRNTSNIVRSHSQSATVEEVEDEDDREEPF